MVTVKISKIIQIKTNNIIYRTFINIDTNNKFIQYKSI